MPQVLSSIIIPLIFFSNFHCVHVSPSKYMLFALHTSGLEKERITECMSSCDSTLFTLFPHISMLILLLGLRKDF
jgi:hypothetical protein